MNKEPNIIELLDKDIKKVADKEIQQQIALNYARKQMKESKWAFILTVIFSIILVILVACFYFIAHLEIYIVIIGEIVAIIFVEVCIRNAYSRYQQKRKEYDKILATNQVVDEINHAIKHINPDLDLKVNYPESLTGGKK